MPLLNPLQNLQAELPPDTACKSTVKVAALKSAGNYRRIYKRQRERARILRAQMLAAKFPSILPVEVSVGNFTSKFFSGYSAFAIFRC